MHHCLRLYILSDNAFSVCRAVYSEQFYPGCTIIIAVVNPWGDDELLLFVVGVSKRSVEMSNNGRDAMHHCTSTLQLLHAYSLKSNSQLEHLKNQFGVGQCVRCLSHTHTHTIIEFLARGRNTN